MSKIREIWWNFLDAWDEKAVVRWSVIALVAFALLMMARCAVALEPGWYAPLDGTGQAIHVRCNPKDRCAVVWETYTEAHGQIFLVSEGLCTRDDAVCDEALSRTTGSFNGRAGDAERLEAEVFITAQQDGDGLLLEWDARDLMPEVCDGQGSGGLLLDSCIHTNGKRFYLLAE